MLRRYGLFYIAVFAYIVKVIVYHFMEMESLFVLTILLFAPTLITLLVWTIVTVYRLYVPETTIPIEQDAGFIRMQATRQGMSIPVGVSEIYEDEARRRREMPPVEYEYPHDLPVVEFPEAWQKEMWLRRN